MWARRQFLEESNQWLIDSATMAGEEGGFTVRVDLLTNENATQTQFAAAEAGTLPDVNSTLLVAFMQRIGVALEVEDLYNEIAETGGGFYDAPTQKVTIDGKIYAVPLNAEPWIMHYRKSIFEAAGFTPPFETMTEFLEACQAVTDASASIWGFGGQMNDNDSEGNIICALHAFGGRLFDENNNIAVNTPETLEGLKFYTDLLVNYQVVPPGAGGWDAAGNNQAYLSGQVASISNTGSVILAMRNDNPDMLDDTVLGPWPAGWNDAGMKTTVVGAFGLVINQNTQWLEQCQQIVRKILSPERYPGNLEAAGSYWFSALQAYSDIPFFTEDAWNRSIQQDVIPFGRAVEWAGGPNPIYDDLKNGLAAGKMVERVTVDGWDPQAALDEFEATALEIAEKYAA